MEGAGRLVRILLGKAKDVDGKSCLGKKATMKIARNIRVFLRFVSKGINVERKSPGSN